MPLYEYRCDKCNYEFEVMQKIMDPAPRECEKCHGTKITKLISRSGFVLKGTGWYETDFKKKPDVKNTPSPKINSAQNTVSEQTSNEKTEPPPVSAPPVPTEKIQSSATASE